jgi:hypothetical protein
MNVKRVVRVRSTDIQDGASSLEEEALISKRQEVSNESLLTALSLVIKANVEYAKGVTDLISSDLNKDNELHEIRVDLKELLTKTETLISTQQELLRALDARNDTSKQHLDKKLAPLYKSAGLKEDGTEYSPTDKVVVKLQTALSSKLVLIFAGSLLLWVAKLVIAALSTGAVK